MRALVTGGAGFIGGALVRRLVAAGADVTVVDNLWRGRLERLADVPGFDVDRQLVIADLSDAGRALELVRDVDLVYHLADAVAGIGFVFAHEPFVFRQNLLINSNVLHACVTNGVPRYVYVGTACSYPRHLQATEHVAVLREDQAYPADPESGYGWSKLMGEYEAELAARAHGLDVGLLRLHNVYGPGADFAPRTSQALPALIRKAVRYPEEEFVVWGSGRQYRDFVYVDDVVEALLRVHERGMGQGVIQIGSERAITLHEAASVIVETSGKDIPLSFDTSRPEGDPGRVAVCDRARQVLGWQPEVSFELGIKRTYRWIAESLGDRTHDPAGTMEPL